MKHRDGGREKQHQHSPTATAIPPNMQSLRSKSVRIPKGETLAKRGQKLMKQPTNKAKVDDRIKRRMSMLRGIEISAPQEAGPPSLPSLPSNVRNAAPRTVHDVEEDTKPQPSKEDTKAADRQMLDQDNFDADAFLKNKLQNSTESELKSLQSSLRSQQDDVATDLQRNVFKNYADFVLISKEVSKLENEMLELKESLSEWRNMPSLLHIDESATAADRRRNARSSVADLRVVYANQMQTLHSQIEGSSKYAPTTSGRHVIAEVDGIMSLNAATYKLDNVVRFIILDDLVLVAKRRKRMNHSESGKQVAEKCWPLNEMLVLDTKDTASMSNVFKIRHAKETHVYRTESASEKKSLLSLFRHTAEELSTKRRKEREGEHERRKTLWADEGPHTNVFSDWMTDLSDVGGDQYGSKARLESEYRWVSDFTDELTVAIALRKWDVAVDLVDQGKARSASMPSLGPKLAPLTASLTSSLLRNLSEPAPKSKVVQLATLLTRLSAGHVARTTFLAARSDVIRKHIRSIRFDGQIEMYIDYLAMVVFTGIKHTADWYLAAFKDTDVTSSLIDWASGEIEIYASMFRRQVFSADVDQQTIEDALRVTYHQSEQLLQKNGLDFRFQLDSLLVREPKSHHLSFSPVIHASNESMIPSVISPTPRRSNASPSSGAVNPKASTPRVKTPTGSANTGSTRSKTPKALEIESLSSPGPLPVRNRTAGSPAPSAIASPRNLRSPAPPPDASLRSRSPASHTFSPGRARPLPADPENVAARSGLAPPPPRSSNRPSSVLSSPTKTSHLVEDDFR